MVGEQPIALSVNKDVLACNVAYLIALANKPPGGMLFGANNRGGQSHITGELFRERAKANISFAHAAGASVSLNDVIAGRFFFSSRRRHTRWTGDWSSDVCSSD